MTTAPSLQAVAGRATADARIPPSCPLVGGASREAVKRWAGASRDALLLTLALARWLAACRGGAAAAVREPVPAARAASAAGVPLRRALRGVRARRARTTRGLSPAGTPARAAPRCARAVAAFDQFESVHTVQGRGEGAKKSARAELASAVPRAPGARARLAGGALAVAAADFALGAAPAGSGWAVGGGAAAAAAPGGRAARGGAAPQPRRPAALPRGRRGPAGGARRLRRRRGAPGRSAGAARLARGARAADLGRRGRRWREAGAAAGLERRCGVGDVEVPSAWGIGSRPRPPFDTQRAAAASRRFVHAAPWRRSCRGGTMLGAWRLRAAA